MRKRVSLRPSQSPSIRLATAIVVLYAIQPPADAQTVVGTNGQVSAQGESQVEPQNNAQNDTPQEKPSSAKYRVVTTKGLRYCDNHDWAGLCDVFLPSRQPSGKPSEEPSGKPSGKTWPTIMLVHGGGWASGDKWAMERHARELTRAGFACVSINYRLAPQHPFPAQVDDLRKALVWMHDHRAEYSFNLDRIGLYGYSAGGHLVSLLATLADEDWQSTQLTTHWTKDDARWKKVPSISAVCVGGPPTDFEYLPPDSIALKFFLGGTKSETPELYRAASPLQHVSKTDPPFQIVHGEKDALVSPSGTETFHRALLESGVESSRKVIPKVGHLLAFLNPELSKTLLTFFQRHLKTQ